MSTNESARRGPASTGQLLLSAMEVVFERPTFAATEAAYDDDYFSELKAREDVFAYRRHGVPPERQLLVMPLSASAELPQPATEFPVADHLRALGAMIEHRLGVVLERLELRRQRRRPFARLRRINRNDDLVSKVFKAIERPMPRELEGFHKYLRTELEVRTVDSEEGRPTLVVTVSFQRHLEVDGTAGDLVDRGLDLRGIGLLDPTAPPGERFIGTAVSVDDGHVFVAAGGENVRRDARQCVVEPSLSTFVTAFDRALSDRDAELYRAAEWRFQAQTTSGRGRPAPFSWTSPIPLPS
jgi:hypothetical protein